MSTPEKIGKSIERIVKAMNSVSIKELDSILESVSMDTTLGPLINPTEWQAGNRYKVAILTRNVIRAIKNFKQEVSGVGNFQKVS